MKLYDFIRQIALTSGSALNRLSHAEDVKAFMKRNQAHSVGKPLIRLGQLSDGGYLVPDDIDGIRTCFSPGIGPSSDFEYAIAEKYAIKCFMADHSVNGPQREHELFHFDKKFLGTENNQDTIRLEDWVTQHAPKNDNEMLLQMDIENHEYPVIIDTPDVVLSRFRIMVIEFHAMEMLLDRNAFLLLNAVFDKLRRQFTIAHIHTNNYNNIWKKADVEVPAVMEFTYLRNDRVELDGQKLTFPHPLDQLNAAHKPPRHLPKCWWGD